MIDMRKKFTLRSVLPIALILCIAALFRFLYLDRIPIAVSGDELVYPITAKSVAITGRDLTGTWNIFQSLIFQYPPNQHSAELPYFLHLPLSGWFPFSVITAHLPFAILSLGTVLLFYLIAQLLFDTPAAIAISFIAAVNPWLVVMGRTGYESTPATFFYLLGFYLLLRLRSWNILWSVIAFVLAFYSYIATKVIFIPFIILTVIIAYIHHRKSYKIPYILVVLFSILFVAFFVISLTGAPHATRISEILIPSAREITSQVDEARKLSINSPFGPLLINKYSVYMQVLINKLFRIISPSYLFIEGDLFFPVRGHAMFYAIDFVFFVLGCLFLFNKRKLYLVLLMIYVLIGALPHMVFKLQGDYSLHLSMMFPVLIVCIGYGVYRTIYRTPKRYAYFLTGVVMLLYLGSIVNFGYIYFFEHPLQEYGDASLRILSKYILFNQESKIPINVFSDSNRDFVNKYLFYTNSLNLSTINVLRKTSVSEGFKLNGVQFFGCRKEIDMESISGVVIIDASCSTATIANHISIPRFKDGGEVFKIYHDTGCSIYNLQRYPNHISFAQLAMDQLNEKQFCETYITKLQ